MKKPLLAILLSIFIFLGLNAQEKKGRTFEIRDGEFVYGGKPLKIYSGEMHYARIPKEYWRHRLKMMKAMGLNTVASYVFWNYHETAPGVWDFKSESRNLREYIKIAQEEGLFVILRPGPYACAEWEFGGYPWWLQKNKDLEIRTFNKPFLDSCRTYLTKLSEQVKGMYASEGGPIIMVQVENEFGSYVAQRKDIPLEKHKEYNKAIKDMLVETGFKGPFFTSDGSWLFNGGSIDGALPTANGENNIENLKKKIDEYHHGKGPYMVAEFYPGWLDHWAEPFQKVKTETTVAQTKKYLENGVSFNYYMVHGGTNFGFTSGANYDGKHDIQPDITSYDYDAPISEAGWATPKYTALRDLLIKHVPYAVPAIPKPIPVIQIPEIKLSKAVNLLELKTSLNPVVDDLPLSFENLDQGHGFVLYSKRFVQPISGKLKIPGLRDFATIYVNGERVGVLNRQSKQYEMDIEIPFNATLDILVENMGRINYGAEINRNTKGIISDVVIDDNVITGGWEMYKMPFSKVPAVDQYSNSGKSTLPTIYSGSFSLSEVGDTFLNMETFGKGIVFVNGRNLGRFWQVGPQQTLYLPGAWLRKGKNEIVVLDQLNDTFQSRIESVREPVLDKLKGNGVF